MKQLMAKNYFAIYFEFVLEVYSLGATNFLMPNEIED